MRDQFLLNPDVVFLNHGSFGACPIPVFDDYQRWQRELERQPVAFLGRHADSLLDAARAVLATYLVADVENLIFVPNATSGVNIVARSLPLQPGDEILTTDHEYGAVDRTWEFVSQKTGARLVRQAFPLPLADPDAFVEQFWAGVTPRTRVIALSHMTSPTAVIFPVEAICQRARAAGIMTVIDGAHVPGHLPLNLTALDADFYTGNLHKWLCAPKGAAFLYARPEYHAMLEPMTISWGWTPEASFVTRHQWQGTRDIAAFLSVPAAIDFQIGWEDLRQQCHEHAIILRERLCDLTGLPPIASEYAFRQMFTVALPPCNPEALKTALYDHYRVEVPVVVWQDAVYLRVSIQVYNTLEDGDVLVEALSALL
ncbi:MAG: aminotransferase class V-fold PLP-dependent enzyme [Anaerolineae bacterium]